MCMIMSVIKMMSISRIFRRNFNEVLKICFCYVFIHALLLAPVHSIREELKLSAEDEDVPVNEVTLPPEDEVIIEEMKLIEAMNSVPIIVSEDDIPLAAKFLVIQVHSHNYNLTLAYNQTLIPHYHINGTNIGLVLPLLKDKPPEVYITNFNMSRNVTAFIAVIAYAANVPIPGGCNMVFSVETSPFLEVRYNSALVTVDVQAASPPLSGIEDCDYSSIRLEIYHIFLPERDYESESYFNGIQKMLTVDRIRKYGIKVNDPLEGPRMRRLFSAYPGTGSVYGVIAVYDDENGEFASAYVPSATYACSPVYWADTCQVLTTTFAKVVCALIFFIGLFMCFCGHTFFRAQIFVHSFLSGGLISYIVFSLYLNQGVYLFSIIFGSVFAFICLSFWGICGWPLFHIIIASLNVGFLLASVIFYAGLGDVDIMVSDINFWTSFIIFTLCAPFILFYMSNKACIIASGVLGAYAVIIPIDHYIGSNLKFIILNTVRRASIIDFGNAVLSPPYQTRDLCLTVAWILLTLVGICSQLCLQMNRPPFPPPPRDFGASFFCFPCYWCISHRLTNNTHINERTPLLVDARIPSNTPPEGYDDVFVRSPYHRQPAAYRDLSA